MKRKYDEEERENEEKKKQRLSNRSSGSNEASSSTSVVPFERRLEILPPEMMEITPSFDVDRVFRGSDTFYSRFSPPVGTFENVADELIGLIASFGVHRELGQINRYLRRLFTITPLLAYPPSHGH